MRRRIAMIGMSAGLVLAVAGCATSDAKHPSELVGTWVGVSPAQEGQSIMTLNADGTEAANLHEGNATWEVDASKITFHFPADSTWCADGTAVWNWSLTDDRLRFEPAAGGTCSGTIWVYTRQSS